MILTFVVNNKIYLATKLFSFIVSYNRELKIKADIRRKEKVEKTMDFVKRMKRLRRKQRQY